MEVNDLDAFLSRYLDALRHASHDVTHAPDGDVRRGQARVRARVAQRQSCVEGSLPL